MNDIMERMAFVGHCPVSTFCELDCGSCCPFHLKRNPVTKGFEKGFLKDKEVKKAVKFD